MIENAVHSLKNADIAFLGINYYETCGSKGKGPELIRTALNSLSSYDIKTGKDAFNELRLCDLGNINAGSYNELRNKTLKKLENPAKFLIMMGGEHLVTLPVIEALSKKEKLNVLILDAHADYYDKYKDKKNSYATVTRRISELTNKVLIAGVRDLTLEEAEDLKNAANVELVSLDEASKKMSDGKWYVSVDLDVLDPVHCPEVSTPIPMGCELRELVKVLNSACFTHEVIGLDVVELTATRKGLSSTTAGGIIMNYLKRRCE